MKLLLDYLKGNIYVIKIDPLLSFFYSKVPQLKVLENKGIFKLMLVFCLLNKKCFNKNLSVKIYDMLPIITFI